MGGVDMDGLKASRQLLSNSHVAVNADTAHLALFDAVGHGSAGGMRGLWRATQ
ncbi:hypothetical protein [Micromonospora sp. NPDC049282]|uniref:hypothetical protein n=1 Tax=Micromonospora sp. NPDC049282 TaxID=3364269 RepID=UPI0037245B42